MIDTEKIASVYAEALLELAQEGAALQDVGEELRVVVDVLRKDDAVWSFFRSPLLSSEEKVKIIEKVFKPSVTTTLYKFLGILAQKKRLNAIPEIYQSYIKLLDEKLGRRRVEVKTSMEVDSGLEKKIAAALKDYLKAEVVLDVNIDPDILGGMVIRSGDLMIDTSVRSGLERMKRALFKRKLLGEEFYEN